MKKLLPLLLAASLTWTTGFGVEASKQSVLQFRLVVPEGTVDSEKVGAPKASGGQPMSVEELQVAKAPLLDGSSVQSSVLATNNLGSLDILITLTESGKERFAKITRENVGKRLAIFVAGNLQSAPTIRSEISGGKAQISGNFTYAEASNLVNQINEAVKK